jgi:hypothetical protein
MLADFRHDLIVGGVAKELVRGLLEDSGYNAYAYGYESLLAQIRYNVQKKRPSETDSILRLRSTPDLLVYNPENGNTFFTEVKLRRKDDPHHLSLSNGYIMKYQKYWNDSVMVVVVPAGSVFYAQNVNKLSLSSKEPKSYSTFDLTSDFLPIETIFTRVTDETVQKYFGILQRLPILHSPEQNAEQELPTEDDLNYWEEIGLLEEHGFIRDY